MFELLCMSIFGVAYITALIKDKKEERLRDIKLKIFTYAIRHSLSYDDVIKMVQNKEISFNEIDIDYEKE